MLAQIFQSTACNAIHSIEQRTAKWIISAMERTNGDDVVPLTHEQLATLLGVGRSYTSRVIQAFKAEGVLETRRGSILVRNPDALRRRSCLCNEAVKNHFEEVLRGVYPSEETIPPDGHAAGLGHDGRYANWPIWPKIDQPNRQQTIVFWRFLTILRRNE